MFLKTRKIMFLFEENVSQNNYIGNNVKNYQSEVLNILYIFSAILAYIFYMPLALH